MSRECLRCRLKRALARCAAGRMATCAWLLVASGLALAADVRITAEFKPSVFNPGKTAFINTTPISGYCVNYPGECPNGKFTIALPLGTVHFGELLPGAPNRESIYFRVPSEFVDVTVRHAVSGEPAIVRFRVSVFSAMYQIDGLASGASDAYGAHAALWQDGVRWVYPAAPCTYSGVGGIGWDFYHFAWGTPPVTHTTPCVKKPSRVIPTRERFRLTNHSVAYELVTPNPFGMKNGVYRGSQVFSVSPHGDFDFGDKAIPSRSSIELEFELTVAHHFQLDMSDAARRAVLEPPRGWGEWLAGAAAPTKLGRDLGFVLSLSAPVTVSLGCASTDGRRCRLDNGQGSRVPYSVALSIPGIVTNAAQPVSRLEMTTDQIRSLSPAQGFTANAKSRIHVEAGEQSVAEMIKHPGSKYADVFTLTFDAQTD